MSSLEDLKVLLRGAGVATIGLIASKAITYFYRALVATEAGPSVYGDLNLAIAVFGITSAFAFFEIQQGLKRYIPSYREEGKKESIKGAVISAYRVTLPLSIATALAVFVAADFIALTFFDKPNLALAIRILAVSIPFAIFSRVAIAVILSFENVKYKMITNDIFQNLIQLAATFFLFLAGYELAAAAGGWTIGIILSSILAFYFMERKMGPLVLSDKEPVYQERKLMRFSGPLLFSTMIGAVLGWTDTFMLGYFMDSAQVGFYNAAAPIAALVSLPKRGLSNLVFPVMSRVSEKSKGELRSMLKTTTRWSFGLSLPAVGLMVVFAPQTLHLLFSKQYTVASTALILLSLSTFINASVGYLDHALKSLDYQDLLMKNSIIQSFLNVPLNLILIPKFGLGLGINGAALASLIATIFANLLILGEGYYYEGIHPFSFGLIYPFISGVIAILPVYIGLNLLFGTVPIWSLIPGGIIFGLLYIVTMFAIKGFTEQDLEIAREAAEKAGMENQFEYVLDYY